MSKKLLIQANNLDLVVQCFMYIYLHPGCSKQDLADYCNFTLRQADYYSNACKYLGLVDDKWDKTSIAIDIFVNSKAEITERVYERIITDDLMGKIFARCYLLPDSDISLYALRLVMEAFPGYSDAVYKRRSDNIVKWCKKIIAYNNLNNK